MTVPAELRALPAPCRGTALRPELATGRVLLRELERLVVALELAGPAAAPGPRPEVVARRAPSCLLAPAPRDRVLLALVPQPYVLAVLERDQARAAEIAFPADASLRAAGRLELSGAAGVEVATGGSVSLRSRLLEIRAAEGKVVLDRLTAIVRAAQAHAGKLGLVADALELFAERLTTRAERSYRFVAGVDQIRGKHLDYCAEDTARIRADHASLTAREVVKIDGEQIHVG